MSAETASVASKGSLPDYVDENKIQRLRKLYDELQLEAVVALEDEPFTAADLEELGLRGEVIVRSLVEIDGVLEVVDRVTIKRSYYDGGRLVNQYRWVEPTRQWFETFAEHRDELPCGCRAHVHRAQDGTLTCKYCKADPERETPAFDRDAVLGAMP